MPPARGQRGDALSSLTGSLCRVGSSCHQPSRAEPRRKVCSSQVAQLMAAVSQREVGVKSFLFDKECLHCETLSGLADTVKGLDFRLSVVFTFSDGSCEEIQGNRLIGKDLA